MSSSILEQLQKIEEQKKALIGGVLQEIQQRIDTLNSAGFHYRLVDETVEPTARRGGAGRKRPTSEHAFLGKMKAAAFRRWGKISEEKKKELWKREEPLAKKFYADKYEDGMNKTGEKYRVQTVPASK